MYSVAPKDKNSRSSHSSHFHKIVPDPEVERLVDERIRDLQERRHLRVSDTLPDMPSTPPAEAAVGSRAPRVSWLLSRVFALPIEMVRLTLDLASRAGRIERRIEHRIGRRFRHA